MRSVAKMLIADDKFPPMYHNIRYAWIDSVETSQPITAAQYGGTVAEPSYSSRGRSARKLPVSAPGRIVLPSPPTNLNIGVDLWNGAHAGAVPVRTRLTEAGISPTTGRWDAVTAEQQQIQVMLPIMDCIPIYFIIFFVMWTD